MVKEKTLTNTGSEDDFKENNGAVGDKTAGTLHSLNVESMENVIEAPEKDLEVSVKLNVGHTTVVDMQPISPLDETDVMKLGDLKDAFNFNLIPSYDENRLIALPRDPYCIYFYWDISWDTHKMAAEFLGCGETISYCARIYNVTGVRFNGDNGQLWKVIKLAPYTNNWYINELPPNSCFVVDVGFMVGLSFITLLRSNPVVTPPDKAVENSVESCQDSKGQEKITESSMILPKDKAPLYSETVYTRNNLND